MNHPYKGRTMVLTTMHQKEQAIAPSLKSVLGANLTNHWFNTDSLGTFTNEIKRDKDMLACAKAKCLEGLANTPHTLGLASEGSFGPHPEQPWSALHTELLFFVDQEKDFECHAFVQSVATNYHQQAVSSFEELEAVAEQCKFPSHGLCLRANTQEHGWFKGIQSPSLLHQVFETCQKLSGDGRVWVSTDMRAHQNPSRLNVIEELANQLANKLASLCPVCDNPGWGQIGTNTGLECQTCRMPTAMIKDLVLGCPKCAHQRNVPRMDGMNEAEAQFCQVCNP